MFAKVKFVSLVVMLLFCSFIFFNAGFALAINNATISARSLFALIPPSIFENTSEGLGDDELASLVDDGQTSFWRISDESQNHLVVSATTPVESQVVLHLFSHTDGGVVAALGSQSGLVCALELWRYDAKRQLLPMPVPVEPSITDLFNNLPSYVDPTLMLCLNNDKILVKPVLWGPDGIVSEKADFEVHYFWNGTNFIKNRTALTGTNLTGANLTGAEHN